MKAMELRSKSVDELKGLLLQHKKESFNLRFQRAVGELENTARVRQVKRLIAKINTILAEKNKVQE